MPSGRPCSIWASSLAAQAHLEQGIALYDPQQHRAHAFRYGQDPGVVCRSYAASTLWYLGYPDQALQRSHEALDPGPGAVAPLQPGVRPVLCGLAPSASAGRRTRPKSGQRHAMALATEQGFPLCGSGWDDLAGLGAGRCRDRAEEGIAQMRQGLAAYGPRGQRCDGHIVWPCWPRRMGKVGQPRKG